MNEAIKIDDLTFEVRRSKRRKTIGVTVERDASLVAHLPEDTSIDAGFGTHQNQARLGPPEAGQP